MPIDNGVFALQSLISEAYCRLEILLEHIQGTIIKPLNGNDKLKMTEHIETLIISGGKAGLAISYYFSSKNGRSFSNADSR